MHTRAIGSLEVAEIGFGCMNLNHAYGAALSLDAASNVLKTALDSGVTLFDTAALYGFGKNEDLVGQVMAPYRNRIQIASKCGMTGVAGKRVIDGRPATLLQTCAEALQRLRVEVIDLYYLHRWDKSVPIEDSVGALSEMVKRGWVREIGLSEVSASTLRKAHSVHKIAAVQNEYSLWTRNPETALLRACEELGIALVAFSPLGRGFLAGTATHASQLDAKDIRRGMPRFQSPHFEGNLKVLQDMDVLAREAQCTKAQLAIAWLLRKSKHIVPIPGTTQVGHARENSVSNTIKIPMAVLDKAELLINGTKVSGARYPAEAMAEIDSD